MLMLMGYLYDDTEELELLPPREKLMEYGPDALSDYELLAIIFTAGTRKEGVLDMSARCLRDYGSLAITNIREVYQVRKLLSIGTVKACQLVATFELGRRFFKDTKDRCPLVKGPEDVHELYKHMARLKREEVRALYLNVRQRVIHEELLAIGEAEGANVSVRNILQPAIELAASSIIIVHNHPSGEVDPSKADRELTRKVKGACAIMDMKLLDHLIIGEGWNSII